MGRLEHRLQSCLEQMLQAYPFNIVRNRLTDQKVCPYKCHLFLEGFAANGEEEKTHTKQCQGHGTRQR
jgi:hypothetical protein